MAGHMNDICITIQIKEDRVFEQVEVFDVLLLSNTLALCQDTPSYVSIFDSTSKKGQRKFEGRQDYRGRVLLLVAYDVVRLSFS